MFFTRSPLPVPSLLRIPTSYSQTKNKTTRLGGFIFLAEKERLLPREAWLRTVGVTASRFAKGILLAFCDTCHSLALPESATGSGRARPSRASVALVQISQIKNKTTRLGGFIFWRRRRDLNSRAGYIRPTPLAGAPLRPLEYFSIVLRELPLPFRSRQIIISYFYEFVKVFLLKLLFFIYFFS